MATYQSVTTGDVIEVGPHVAKARRALAAAELLALSGFPEDAAVRAHQSTIHAERALLATEKRSPQEVWSVHRLATQHFLQPEQLPADFAGRLDDLAIVRARADDQPAGRVDAADSESALALAREFLEATETWLRAGEFLEGDEE